MPRQNINLSLDFRKKEIYTQFRVKQFDDITLNITPLDNGLPYDTTNMTARVFIGCDGDMFAQDTNISVTSSKVIVALDRNMLSNSGKAYGELELTNSEGTSTTSTFIFDIDGKIGEGASIPGNIEGFVSRYEKLIAEFKKQASESIASNENKTDQVINIFNSNSSKALNDFNFEASEQMTDFENRFNTLTASQQQSAEVVDARDGESSLNARLERDISISNDRFSKIEGLQDSANFEYYTEKGYVIAENTQNGQVDSLKLEGRTLVNLIRGVNTFYYAVDNNKIYSPNVPLKQKLAEGETYTYIAYGYTDNITTMYLGDNVGFYFDVSKPLKFTCNTEMSKISSVSPHFGTTHNGVTLTVADGKDIKLLLLEGDHTQNPPSYFEGLKSVGEDVEEIEVASRKEDGNLFDKYTVIPNNAFAWASGSIMPEQGSFASDYISVVEGKYSFTNEKGKLQILALDFNKKPIGFFGSSGLLPLGTPVGDSLTSILVPKNVHYIRFALRVSSGIGFDINKHIMTRGDLVGVNIYKNQAKPLYYKNEQGEIVPIPILREWDKIENGKYIVGSGQVTLNGSESAWVLSSARPPGGTTLRFTGDIINNWIGAATFVFCDKFDGAYTHDKANNHEVVWLHGLKKTVEITINKSKLSTQDPAGFKAWLQANPTTIVYQLATPKIYDIINLDLDSYEGETMVSCSSGAISPRMSFEITSHIGNTVNVLRDRIGDLEERQLDLFKMVLAGNMQELAYELYPNDFRDSNDTMLLPIN